LRQLPFEGNRWLQPETDEKFTGERNVHPHTCLIEDEGKEDYGNKQPSIKKYARHRLRGSFLDLFFIDDLKGRARKLDLV
jgi:hypothetical protein